MSPRCAVRRIVLACAGTLAGLLSAAAPAAAQAPACAPFLDGPRLPAPAPAPGLRRQTELLAACGTGAPGLSATPAVLRARWRSAYPYDRNDGILWGGRGLSAAAGAGVAWAAGPLRLTLHPEVSVQQNRAFELAGDSGFAYLDPRIDFPQRFGEDAFWRAAPGQSALVLTAGPVELAAATESLWWGPARRYPLLLGSSAPGFPHVRVGTAGARDVGIGRLAVDVLWGRLDESSWFDDDASNDHRLLTGVFVELTVLDGLSLGLAGVQHNAWSERSGALLDAFTPFADRADSSANGLLSLTARWHLAASEMSVYAEWAREDRWESLRELVDEIDHSQGWMLGFEKIVRGTRVPFRLSGELAHLGTSPTRRSRLDRTPQGVTFYQHAHLRQGHTHQGQLLGAPIGPGSDAQTLAVDLLLEGRTLGAYVERVRRDEDSYYWFYADDYGTEGHDVELTLGLTGAERVGPLDVRWSAALSGRRNRSFLGLDGESPPSRRETNVELAVAAVWLPAP